MAEQNRDLEEEIIGNEKEIEVLNVAIDKATSGKSFYHSATSSLADELDIANNEFFECGDKPQIVQGLESHIRSEHEGSSEKKFLETKLNEIKTKINEQKVKLTSTLFRLKEKESLEIETCNCKNFCQINHFKQNWRRSVSSDIFSKMKMVNNLSDELKENNARNSCQFCEESFQGMDALESHIQTVHGKEEKNHLKKNFACNQCEQNFDSMELLKKHIATTHK